MNNQTTQMPQKTYNGWANYETWNVALNIQNDKFLYNTAVACVEYHNPKQETPYDKFIRCMVNVEYFKTIDDVSWYDELIDTKAINDMMYDLHS